MAQQGNQNASTQVEDWLKITADNLSQYKVEIDGKTWLNLEKIFATGQHPVFSGLVLDVPVTFRDGMKKEFPRGISFINVTFAHDVSLREVLFNGPMYFWDCQFQSTANFFRCKVLATPAYGRIPGEVNFSYTRFGSEKQVVKPSFDWAEFEGEAFFHRTAFPNGVDFAGTKFIAGVIFESSENDVCLAKELFSDKMGAGIARIGKKMYDRGVIHDSAYSEAHYNFDWLIPSREALEKRLKDLKPAPNILTSADELDSAVQTICNLWDERFKATMFGVPFEGSDAPLADIKVTSFRWARFGGHSAFRHVDLSWCLFQGANLSDVEFLVAHWGKTHCGLLSRCLPGGIGTRRSVLYDEIELRNEKDGDDHLLRKEELSELYRELRIAYDKEGDSHRGRDFYYGEMEMERLSKPLPARFLSLSFLYRTFAGYSKREGLALAWLLFFVAMLFPAIFSWIGWNEHKVLKQQSDEFVQQLKTPAIKNDATKADAIDKKQDIVARANDVAWGHGGFWSPLERAETASLQASTFLTSAEQTSAMTAAAGAVLPEKCSGFSNDACSGRAKTIQGFETRRRLFEGLERLLVVSQLGLFLLSLRSRFQRGS